MKKNFSLIFVIVLFLFISLVLNFSNWKEIILKKNTYEISFGDSAMAEFMLENNYQHIIQGENPFVLEKQLFHPFSSINISLNDPGVSNSIYALILRPFLDTHKTMVSIVIINIFLNNLLMFLLLRKLRISDSINLITSLTFGYLPTMSYRVFGHFTYTSIYIFPAFFLLILKLLEEKFVKKKVPISLLLGFLMAFVVLLNFYYFIGLCLMIFLF